MCQKIFSDVVVDPQRQARLRQRPPAQSLYILHFTPRSGSSWLTDILAATNRLGAANEVFNPEFMPDIAQAIDAPDMETYIQMLLRRFNTNGVFGAEVTAHQIAAVFEDYMSFHRHFGSARCFWLIRQDIVAQAVSLAKMVATNVAHLGGSDAGARRVSEKLFAYDPAAIRHWLDHIHAAETMTETWFETHGLEPLRMSYEQTIRLSELQMVNVVARHLGVADIAPMTFSTAHGKLGTEQNLNFATRFREEHAAYLARIEARRAPMLERLHPIAEIVADL